MTNEVLAEYIQQSGNDELIPILWEKVRKLLYMKSDKFYRLHQVSCDRSGLDKWDIRQVSYIAFLEAVKAYKSDSGCKFTSFLEYPFKKVVRELLGIRTTKREPLNECSSLDAQIESSEGDSCSILDLIADDTALEFVEEVSERSEAETIRQIVDTLPEPYRSIIQAHYFEGLTLKEIAERLSVSGTRVRQRELKALAMLRQNDLLRKLYTDSRFIG